MISENQVYLSIAMHILFISTLNTGILILLDKWKILKWYQIHRKEWMPECSFCFFFWLSVFEILFFFNLVLNFKLLFIYALCSAVVSRRMLI